MASLTVTAATGEASDQIQEGDKVVIQGEGFHGNSPVTIEIVEIGEQGIVTSDYGGFISSVAYDKKAGIVLTAANGQNAIAAETVTIGAVTYTWRATVGTTANEVLIGANFAESLRNLKAAVNLDPTLASVYGSATVVHPTVHAGELTALTLTLQAKTGGTGGNSLASTDTMTQATFGAATFGNGAASGSVDFFEWYPTNEGGYTVKATDGTNSAQAAIRVWSH